MLQCSNLPAEARLWLVATHYISTKPAPVLALSALSIETIASSHESVRANSFYLGQTLQFQNRGAGLA